MWGIFKIPLMILTAPIALFFHGIGKVLSTVLSLGVLRRA